jgi:hypothetical protein
MEKNMNMIEDVTPKRTRPKIVTLAAIPRRILSCKLDAVN